MRFHLTLFVFAISFTLVATQIAPEKCLRPISFGKTCATALPSLRYHFDNETGLCLAFKFNGCEGNENNFESSVECSDNCKPTDIVGCPVRSEPLPRNNGEVLCKETEDCRSEGYCSKRLSGGGICCRRTIREKLDADYNSSCGTGRILVKLDEDQVLIGKNCGSNFCPNGSKCKKGKYFSTCCKKV